MSSSPLATAYKKEIRGNELKQQAGSATCCFTKVPLNYRHFSVSFSNNSEVLLSKTFTTKELFFFKQPDGAFLFFSMIHFPENENRMQ